MAWLLPDAVGWGAPDGGVPLLSPGVAGEPGETPLFPPAARTLGPVGTGHTGHGEGVEPGGLESALLLQSWEARPSSRVGGKGSAP